MLHPLHMCNLPSKLLTPPLSPPQETDAFLARALHAYGRFLPTDKARSRIIAQDKGTGKGTGKAPPPPAVVNGEGAAGGGEGSRDGKGDAMDVVGEEEGEDEETRACR